MTFAIFENDHPPELVIRRDSKNKIIITTEETLTDEQMASLYYVTYLMMKTRLPLGEILKTTQDCQ